MRNAPDVTAQTILTGLSVAAGAEHREHEGPPFLSACPQYPRGLGTLRT